MVYQLFNEFVQTFLVERKDFLSGSGKIVLTPETLNECVNRFIVNFIEGSDQSFSEKLTTQFADASQEARIVFAHVSWLYLHPHKGMTAKGRYDAVMMSLINLHDYKIRDSIFLDKEGIANGGTAYNTQKPANLKFIIYLFQWIKGSKAGIDINSIKKAIVATCLYGVYGEENVLKKVFGSEKTEQIIEELIIFKTASGEMIRLGILNFLLNLCEPDYYERIVSFEEKRLIAENLFKAEYGSEVGLNTDDKIYLIKRDLVQQYPEIDPNYLLREDQFKVLWQQPKRQEGNYWLFQCNPDVYDIVSALREVSATRWRVTKHSTRIKIGDKVILWVTGKEAGCYALGEVNGEIEHGVRDIEDQQFYKDESYNVPGDRVMINIIHNLVEKPVLKHRIEALQDLAELKAGNQGTNFSATAKQYEALRKLAEGSVPQTISKKYWLFSPGENAEMWDRFYSKHHMAIGWNDLGDMAQYDSLESVETRLNPNNAVGFYQSRF